MDYDLPLNKEERKEIEKIGEADYLNNNLKKYLINNGLDDGNNFKKLMNLYYIIFFFILSFSIFIIGNLFEGIGLSILIIIFLYKDLQKYIELQKNAVIFSNDFFNKTIKELEV